MHRPRLEKPSYILLIVSLAAAGSCAFQPSRQHASCRVRPTFCRISTGSPKWTKRRAPRVLASQPKTNEDDAIMIPESFSVNATMNNVTTTTTVNDSVDALRARASQLRREATAMELALSESRQAQGQQQQSAAQALYDRLFLSSFNATSTSLAAIMTRDQWSVDQALQVLELLYQQRQRYDPQAMASPSNKVFQIGSVNNVAPIRNDTFLALVEERKQALLAAAEQMDQQQQQLDTKPRWSGRGQSILAARWKELELKDAKDYERAVLTNLYRVVSRVRKGPNETAVQDYMQATLGLPTSRDSNNARSFNMSRVMERVRMIPSWLPSPLLGYMAKANATLAKDDITRLKDRVLPGSGFFVTGTDAIPSAALFRGNLRPTSTSSRTSNAKDVFEEIERRLQVEGLDDRILLFLLEDISPSSDRDTVPSKPVLLALSKLVQPIDPPSTRAAKLLKQLSVVLTMLTSVAYSVSCYALNPQFFDAIVNQGDARALTACVPVALGVLMVQTLGEGARWLVCKRRNMRMGWPLPLPSPWIGTFGCLTPLRSFPANRSTMLEFALASPLTGFVLSTGLMILGTFLTIRSPEAVLASFPYLPVAILKSSLFVGSILTYLAPKLIILPLAQPVPMHPLFVIGFAGVVASSLNLLPIFRLDGGRACTAALGNRVGAVASVSSLMFMLSVSISSESGLGLAWCMIITLFRRSFEIPARDEITPVDKARLRTWMAGLVGAMWVLLPFPGGNSIL